MRLLLDTHAFLWFVQDNPQLSDVSKKLLEDGQNELFLSISSAWEIAINVSIGKLVLAQEYATFLAEELRINRITLLPLQLTHLNRVVSLPFHHKDPFDHIIIAQSLTENLPLVSIENPFDTYGIQRIW